VRHDELADQNCAIARSTAVLGERWVWVILRQAFTGTRRFDDFQKTVGLSRNMLADRLSHLVDHDILRREQYAETPRPLFEYRLTDKGKALFPSLLALMRWGEEWTDLPDGPPVEVVHDSCGQVTHATVVCSECGEALDARHTHGRPAAPSYVRAQ